MRLGSGTKQKIYGQIDNDFYDKAGDSWWLPDSPLLLLQSSFNPARIGYYNKVLFSSLNLDPKGKSALEVGCGGGFLCEEISRMGFNTYGVDPSLRSLHTAVNHSKANGLRIHYQPGTGEALPYGDNTMDVVFCCDVLEHISDVEKVISEISRVLKPGGFFCYDTFNRTFLSKLVAVKISQEWGRWAFAPPNLHVWSMFIKPKELDAFFVRSGLKGIERKGMKPNVSFPKLLRCLRKRAKGLLTYTDIGNKLFMVESKNTSIMYMGYAIKMNHADGRHSTELCGKRQG